MKILYLNNSVYDYRCSDYSEITNDLYVKSSTSILKRGYLHYNLKQ